MTEVVYDTILCTATSFRVMWYRHSRFMKTNNEKYRTVTSCCTTWCNQSPSSDWALSLYLSPFFFFLSFLTKIWRADTKWQSFKSDIQLVGGYKVDNYYLYLWINMMKIVHISLEMYKLNVYAKDDSSYPLNFYARNKIYKRF